jgi:DivIVA domain-containing protein
MDMSPKAISSATFPLARKGYDQEQVRTFLARVARGVEELQTRTLQAEAKARLQEPAAPVAPMPAPPAGDAATLEGMTRTLVMAQRTADATVAEAKTEAEGIRAQAEERAETMLAEARARADNLVAAAEAQAARTVEQLTSKGKADAEALEHRRQQLLDDIARLGAHMGSQRERIAATVDVLRRALDHPDGLQVTALPELSAESTELPPAGVADVPPAPGSTESIAVTAAPAPGDASRDAGNVPAVGARAGGGPDTGPVDVVPGDATMPTAAPGSGDTPATEGPTVADPYAAQAPPADATPAAGMPAGDDTDAWKRFFGDQPAGDDRWSR